MVVLVLAQLIVSDHSFVAHTVQSSIPDGLGWFVKHKTVESVPDGLAWLPSHTKKHAGYSTQASRREHHHFFRAESEKSLCHSHIQDGRETDIDCGGPVCRPCGTGKKCAFESDCATGKCIGATLPHLSSKFLRQKMGIKGYGNCSLSVPTPVPTPQHYRAHSAMSCSLGEDCCPKILVKGHVNWKQMMGPNWKDSRHYPNALAVMGEYELVRGKVHNARPVYRRAFMGERFIFYNAILTMWVLSYLLHDDLTVKESKCLFGAKSSLLSPDRVGKRGWSVVVKGSLIQAKSVDIRCSSCQGIEIHIPHGVDRVDLDKKGSKALGVGGSYIMDSELSHGKSIFKQEAEAPWYLFYMEIETHDETVGQWVFGKEPRAFPVVLVAVSDADSPDKIDPAHPWEVVDCVGDVRYCHHPLLVTCKAATGVPTATPTKLPTTIVELWRSETAGIPIAAPTVSPTLVPTHPTPHPTRTPSNLPTAQPTHLPIPSCQKLHVVGNTPRLRNLLGWYALVNFAVGGTKYFNDHPVYTMTYMDAKKVKAGAKKATKLEHIMAVEENWESGFVQKRAFLYFRKGILATRRLGTAADDDDEGPGDDDGEKPSGSWVIGPTKGAPPYLFIASSDAATPDKIHKRAWKVWTRFASTLLYLLSPPLAIDPAKG
jgi:hypothetical protein